MGFNDDELTLEVTLDDGPKAEKRSKQIKAGARATAEELVFLLVLSFGLNAEVGYSLFREGKHYEELRGYLGNVCSASDVNRLVLRRKSGKTVVTITSTRQFVISSGDALGRVLQQAAIACGFSSVDAGFRMAIHEVQGEGNEAGAGSNQAFGRRFGGCRLASCGCQRYRSSATAGSEGGPCQMCGHYPALHQDVMAHSDLHPLDPKRTVRDYMQEREQQNLTGDPVWVLKYREDETEPPLALESVGLMVKADSRAVPRRKSSAAPASPRFQRRRSSAAHTTAHRSKLAASEEWQASGMDEFNSKSPLFGVSLDAVPKSENGVPRVVLVLCEYLMEQDRLAEEGIFRVPGMQSVISEYRSRLEADTDSIDFNQEQVDSCVIADLLKTYLRELPEGILSADFYDRWIVVGEMDIELLKLEYCRCLLASLPWYSVALARYLLDFLDTVNTHRERNKMVTENLAMIFAPIFVRRGRDSMPASPATSRSTSASSIHDVEDSNTRRFSVNRLRSLGKDAFDSLRRKDSKRSSVLQTSALEAAKEYASIQKLILWMMQAKDKIFANLESAPALWTMKATRSSETMGELAVKRGDIVYLFRHESDALTWYGERAGEVGIISQALLKRVK